MKVELKAEESFHTGPHSEEYFTPGLFLVAILSLSLLHLSVKIWKSYFMHLWIHISAPSACSKRENSIYLTVIYTCAFFLCHSRWKHVCDHGQHFPFLKCRLLLLLCQFVSEENGSWKTPLFGFALSMETGPYRRLAGQQAAFTGFPALSRVFYSGLDTVDTLVSAALLRCPCFPEHWAWDRPWRKGLLRSREWPLAPHQPLLIEEKIDRESFWSLRQSCEEGLIPILGLSQSRATKMKIYIINKYLVFENTWIVLAALQPKQL